MAVERSGRDRAQLHEDAGDAVVKTAIVPLAAVDTAGGLFAWDNPESNPVEVIGVTLDIRTASSGACTVDVGVAANATTSNDTLIDGVSIAAAGTKSTAADPGTNGKASRKATAAQYVTGSVASGASAGVVGEAIITYRSLRND
jgi:hypothetical protein